MPSPREQILVNLYCLRAGMSLISSDLKSVTDIKREIDYNEKKLEFQRSESLWQQKRIEEYKNNPHPKKIKKEKTQKQKYKQQRRLYIFRYISHCFIIPLLVCAFLLFTNVAGDRNYKFNFSMQDLALWGKYFMIHLQAILMVFVGLAIFLIIKERKTFKVILGFRYLIKNAKEEKQITIEDEIREPIVVDQNLIKKQKTLRESIPKINNRVIFLKDFLIEQYGKMLDVRDWGNLDLIIYYVETNRANTIQESLLRLDKQLMSDELNKNIKASADYLAHVVSANANSLRETMKSGFNSISQKISDFSSEINRRFDMANNKLSSINSTLSNIYSASECNKALMNKISVDSQSLYADLKKIM